MSKKTSKPFSVFLRKMSQIISKYSKLHSVISTAEIPPSPSPTLILAQDQIRLLDLLPGSKDEPICYELTVVSIHDQISFETLSYVWGATTKTKYVRTNGILMSITDNLYNALSHLRLPDKKRTLWIDQLCIEQCNTKEKSQQVNLMGRIYQSCNHCLIWLGDFTFQTPQIAESDAKNALKLFHALADWNSSVEDPFWASDNKTLSHTKTAIQGLINDYMHWSSRIWTLQEIVLSPAAAILWGSLSIEWTILEKATLEDMGPEPLHQFWSHSLKEFYLATRNMRIARDQTAGKDHVIHALHRWRYRDASNPRDKIYALMGLYPDSFSRIRTCDYNLAPGTIFARVTLDLISMTDDLCCLVGWGGEPHVTADLPTWARDWVCHPDPMKRNTNWFKAYSRYSNFNACGEYDLQWANWRTLGADSVLVLKGMAVDTVKAVGNTIVVGTGKVSHAFGVEDHLLIGLIKSWEGLVQSYRPATDDDEIYVAGGSWRDAFWRTLLGDAIMEEFLERRATEHDSELVTAFRNNSLKGDVNEAYKSLCEMVIKRTFFITDSGYIGIGPPTTSIGDQVWILAGARFPFILRPSSREARTKPVEHSDGFECTFVGDAYVHGIMDGELMKDRDDSTSKFQTVMMF